MHNKIKLERLRPMIISSNDQMRLKIKNKIIDPQVESKDYKDKKDVKSLISIKQNWFGLNRLFYKNVEIKNLPINVTKVYFAYQWRDGVIAEIATSWFDGDECADLLYFGPSGVDSVRLGCKVGFGLVFLPCALKDIETQ